MPCQIGKLHPALREGPWTSMDQFVQVLGEGFDFDPLSSLHMYYAVLSTVSLGIPVLTGAVVLRSRRGILASFTDAPRKQALDRGTKAGTAFSLVAQNKRNRMMLQIDGAAQSAAYGGVGKVNGGAKRIVGQMSRGFETLTRMASTIKPTDNPVEAAKKMMQANEAGIQRAMQMTAMEAEHERILFSRYDKRLGRASITQQLHEAGSSAMDDGTGYELSRHANYGYAATLKVMTGKLDFAMKNYADIVSAVHQQPAQLGKSAIAKVFSDDKSGGYTEVMLFGSAAFGAMLASGSFKENAKSFNMQTLKKFLKAEAYTDEEILARAFHLDRFVLKNPTVRDAIFGNNKEGKDKIVGAREAIGAEIFDRFFGALTKNPPPGGATHSIDIYMSAAGGDKWLGPPPAEMARHMSRGVSPKYIEALSITFTCINAQYQPLNSRN